MSNPKLKNLQSQNKFFKDFSTDGSYGKHIRLTPPLNKIRNGLELTNFINYIADLLGLKTSKRNTKTRDNLNIYITFYKNKLSQYLSTLQYYYFDNNPIELNGVKMPDDSSLKIIYQNMHNELDKGIDSQIEIFRRNSNLLSFSGAAVCSFMVSFDSDGDRIIVAGYKIINQGKSLHKSYPDYVYEEKLKLKANKSKNFTTDLQSDEPQVLSDFPNDTDLFFNPLDSDSEMFL